MTNDNTTKKPLKLVLKYKWYDMIDAGIKKQEYRDIKPGIVGLLFDWKASGLSRPYFTEGMLYHPDTDLWQYLKDFDQVEFYRGYSRTRKTMRWELKKVRIGKAKPKWSDNMPGRLFVLQLGKRIKNNE